MLEWLSHDTLIKSIFLMYAVTVLFVLDFLMTHFFSKSTDEVTQPEQDIANLDFGDIDFDKIPEYKP
jgi:hypothetical protein